MGKYEPLANHLKAFGGNRWDATFEEIEEILKCQLPPSARRHPSWWSNSYRGNHSQAQGWVGVGWITRDIEPTKGRVSFEKTNRAGRSIHSQSHEELWQRAKTVTGIKDRGELEAVALKALLQQESARYIASLGGTMPEAEAAPRRRFD